MKEMLVLCFVIIIKNKHEYVTTCVCSTMALLHLVNNGFDAVITSVQEDIDNLIE